MPYLTPDAKNQLSRVVRTLRTRLITDFNNAAESTYRLSIGKLDQAGLAEEPRERRRRLEAWLEEQVRAESATFSTAALKGDKLKAAQQESRKRHFQAALTLAAATLLNRLIVIRQMEALGIRRTKLVTGGWSSPAYREFREFAPDLCKDDTEGYGFLLQLLYDELALDLPGLFGPVGLTALFPIPASTLRAVIEALEGLDPDTWLDDTTLGWVYQYWNDPEREALDAKLNSGGKVAPHEIASKTQMFTERYMVEWLLHNSLGQQWLAICQGNGWTPAVVADGTLDRLEARRKDWREKRDRSEVALDALMPIESEQEDRWKYWVKQPPLAPLGLESGAGDEGQPMKASIRDLKIFDPACGSGHFLIIAFGLLFAFYQEEAQHQGETWDDRDIVESILTHNLHGLDLDPRAVQIAAAALYLKAKTLCPEAELTVLNLVAANLNLAALPEDDPAVVELGQAVKAATGIPEALTNQIVQGLKGADAWGSLLKVDEAVDGAIAAYERQLWRQGNLLDAQSLAALPERGAEGEGGTTRDILIDRLERFLTLRTRGDDLGLRLRGEQLAAGVRFVRLVREGSYDLVIGNPPYQGTSKMQDAKYVAKHYPKAKADLYAAFLQRGLELTNPGGLSAMLTMRNWMFISQYSAIREFLIDTYDLRLIGDLETGAFQEVSAAQVILSVAMSIFCKFEPTQESSLAFRPAPNDLKSEGNTNRKRAAVLAHAGHYEFQTQRFDVIKEKPIVYWWDDDLLNMYIRYPVIGEVAPARATQGFYNNTRFFRKSHEVSINSIELGGNSRGSHPWKPLTNGANGIAWIEPLREVVRWGSHGYEPKLYMSIKTKSNVFRYANEQFFFIPGGVAYTAIGEKFSARSSRYVGVFADQGRSLFGEFTNQILCLLNSTRAGDVASSLNPTIHFQTGDVNRLPLFPIESADEIFAQLDRAFTEHEAARETSVEFQQPGPSCWAYAQAWAQEAVDRAPGTPLPDWQAEYDPVPAVNWVSYAIGLALGRFPLNPSPHSPIPSSPLPHGILYLSTHSGDQPDSPDSLNHPTCQPLHQAWAEQGSAIIRGKSLHHWLRLNFFKDVHLGMYEQRPIYFPLSSEKKNFVALISIHRWADDTLLALLADYLIPDQTQLDGEIADLIDTKAQGDAKAQTTAEKRYTELMQLKAELDSFIQLLRQCAETGPPAAKASDPQPEVAAKYRMDLDDGVMINSAALWPLLAPQWAKPKTWWSELCTATGRKDYDWSHLAARYFPTRVDTKSQRDPSLAVAHGVFWKYHPAKAYEWELRLQDEIGPDFTIDETDSDTLRQQFETAHPQTVADLREKEEKRRERKYKKNPEAQLSLEV